MTLQQASRYARQHSIRYTFWYVREVAPGEYQTYAHHSNDARTVACFMSGKEWTEDDEG